MQSQKAPGMRESPALAFLSQYETIIEYIVQLKPFLLNPTLLPITISRVQLVTDKVRIIKFYQTQVT